MDIYPNFLNFILNPGFSRTRLGRGWDVGTVTKLLMLPSTLTRASCLSQAPVDFI